MEDKENKKTSEENKKERLKDIKIIVQNNKRNEKKDQKKYLQKEIMDEQNEIYLKSNTTGDIGEDYSVSKILEKREESLELKRMLEGKKDKELYIKAPNPIENNNKNYNMDNKNENGDILKDLKKQDEEDKSKKLRDIKTEDQKKKDKETQDNKEEELRKRKKII